MKKHKSSSMGDVGIVGMPIMMKSYVPISHVLEGSSVVCRFEINGGDLESDS